MEENKKDPAEENQDVEIQEKLSTEEEVPAPAEMAAPEHPRSPGEGTGKSPKNPKNKNFLFIYAVSLLLIAFVLILLSYLSQIRSANEQIASLQEEQTRISVSALQNLENLQEQKELLEEEKVKLEARIEALENELEAREKELDETEGELEAALTRAERLGEELDAGEKRTEALKMLAEFDYYYSLRMYAYCSERLMDYLAAGYEGLWSSTGPDGEYGPDDPINALVENYEEMLATLERRGWIEKDSSGSWQLTD